MESMERCTGHCHITEIMLKIAIQSIHSCFFIFVVQFKVHADDNINVTQNLNSVLGRVQTFWEKGENAGYHHFLLFPKYFQRASSSRVIKSWYRVKNSNFKFLKVKGRKLIYLTLHFLIIL